MNIEEFVQESARTESPKFCITQIGISTLHGIVGISTEAGELLDAVKRSLFYGRTLDLANVREEIGDIMWYIACILREQGWSLDDIMGETVEKLKKRYPEQWSEQHAQLRLDKEDTSCRNASHQ